MGCGGNDTTSVNFYYILASSHFFENTHAILSNFPCDTKSIKKLGAGGHAAGRRVTKASRSVERTGRKELILPWKTGRKTGELSDGAASGRCRLRAVAGSCSHVAERALRECFLG